jgi:hypothetical protein
VGITATATTVHDIEASPVFSKKLEAPRIGILTSSLSRDTLSTPILCPAQPYSAQLFSLLPQYAASVSSMLLYYAAMKPDSEYPLDLFSKFSIQVWIIYNLRSGISIKE